MMCSVLRTTIITVNINFLTSFRTSLSNSIRLFNEICSQSFCIKLLNSYLHKFTNINRNVSSYFLINIYGFIINIMSLSINKPTLIDLTFLLTIDVSIPKA